MGTLYEYPSEDFLSLVRELLHAIGFHHAEPDDTMRMSLDLGSCDLSGMRRSCFGVLRRHYPENASREELEEAIREFERYRDGILVGRGADIEDALGPPGMPGEDSQYYEDLEDDHPMKPLLDMVLKVPIEMLKARLAGLEGE
jgi:hypothetical protein